MALQTWLPARARMNPFGLAQLLHSGWRLCFTTTKSQCGHFNSIK
ncbi:MAG: hypothetical protein NUV44_01225 [Candidatus Scalindua sp.]|nr:hypothetical protein [Candidatus Scalindua sp.]